MSRVATATTLRLGVVLAAFLFPRVGLTQSSWIRTDLGTLGGLTSSAANINATGQVVGTSATASGANHAFIWTATGGMVDLGTLGGPSSSASAINAAGQVLGQSTTASAADHAFVWTAADGMVDLGTLGGQTSTAVDINDTGEVIGTSLTADGGTHGFVWSATSGLIDLGSGIPKDINNAGQVVGYATMASGDHHAFLWMASTGMLDLGTLGGTWSEADVINDSGQVVGRSTRADGSWNVFMWTEAGGMVDLSWRYLCSLSVHAINNAGQVVGSALVYTGCGRPSSQTDGDLPSPQAPRSVAFSWTAAGGLRTFGEYSTALNVNTGGQVVGVSPSCGTPVGAFVWTAATYDVCLVRFDYSLFYSNSARAINDAGQIVGAASDVPFPIPRSATKADVACSTGGSCAHAVLWQPPLSVTALTPNVTFPVTAGTPITWTASARGGVAAPYTFQFLVFDGTTWTLGRDWSASASWTWEPPLPGAYTVQVWVRNSGSSAAYDAWLGASATISMPSVLTLTTVTASVPSVPAGTDVTWTATIAGPGTGPYTYKFFVFDGTTWRVGQDWSQANTWTWTPAIPGTYLFQVWLRNAGSTAAYDAWRTFGPHTATRPSALTMTALTMDAAPISAGMPVGWTANASGGNWPYSYRFLLYDLSSGSWSVARDWSASNTWTWLPTNAGTYVVQAWVRDASPYDAWAQSVVTVTESAALLASVTSSPITPVPAGTPVTWTARGVGGTGPYTFKFLVYDGTAWKVGRDWGPSSSWTWTASIPGTYFVQAWIRNAGSSSAYDAWIGAPALTILGATPFPIVTLTSAPMSPLFDDELAAVLTATAVGGSGPYTYQFWVYDGSTWMVGQPWSPSSVYAWRPRDICKHICTRWIQVWVRNAGSTSPYDAWTGLGPLIVLP